MVNASNIVYQLKEEEKLGLLDPTHYLENDYVCEGKSIISSVMKTDNVNTEISLKEKEQHTTYKSKSDKDQFLDESFLLIADNSSDFISITTFSMKPVYLYVNSSFSKYFGYEKDELIGQNSLDHIHPEDVKKLTPILKKYITLKAKNIFKKEKQSFSEKFECRIKDKSGKWHVFNSTANNLGENILFIAKDITKTKQEEERYRIISEVTTDLIYEWDIENNTLDWYGDIDKELGYEPGEIERTIKGWVSLIHPEDQERLKNAVELHMESITPIFEEYRILHKDGTWRYWRDKGTPVLNKEGKPKKWIGGCTDITDEINTKSEIKEEKQFIDSILKSLPGIFYLFDTNGQFLRWNTNFEIVTGYSSKELKLMTPLDLFEGEDKDTIAEAIKRAYEIGYADVEADFHTKSGKKIPFFFTGVKTIYQDKPLIVGVGIDLSKIKNMEHELNMRIYQLETIEKLAVNRELKMISLKKEINKLLTKQGKNAKYEINEL